MTQFPTLKTERLLLRQFLSSDATRVQQLAGTKEVALGTLVIPHPYQDGMAEEWIERQQREYEAGTHVTFAITLLIDDTVIGSIGLEIQHEHHHARVGYWLGVPYWNQGYGTEAVKAVLAFGFTTLNLHRLYASHFHDHPASGRVLQNAGMTYEGRLRGHYVRLGRRVDVDLYGMLK